MSIKGEMTVSFEIHQDYNLSEWDSKEDYFKYIEGLKTDPERLRDILDNPCFGKWGIKKVNKIQGEL